MRTRGTIQLQALYGQIILDECAADTEVLDKLSVRSF